MKGKSSYIAPSAVICEGVVIGEECNIGDGVHISRHNTICDRVSIGDFTGFSSQIHCYNDCNIGKFCAIGAGAVLAGPPHHLDLISISNRLKFGDGFVPFRNYTVIGNDVWIGANVVIRANVYVGDGAVIGANSTVLNDIPPYAIAHGSPAVVNRYRFSPSVIKELLELKWWDIPSVSDLTLPIDVMMAIDFLREVTRK